MINEIILAFLFYGAGILICSFGFIQLLILLRVGFPYTRYLRNKGIKGDYIAIYKSYTMSIAVISILLAIALFLIFKFCLLYQIIAFFVGVIQTLIFGIGKTGINTNDNVIDYFKVMGKHLVLEDTDEVNVLDYK